jgi:hydroxylaminobenzene mutase
MDESRRRLIWHGMFLFLLGLLTGLVETKFSNPRMGLAAHLEGLMNGIFLVALGSVWGEVRLSRRWKSAAFGAALIGTYGNWAVTVLAAVFRTTALTPIAGAGQGGLPWQEALVAGGFSGVGIVIIASSVMILWGLRGRAKALA